MTVEKMKGNYMRYASIAVKNIVFKQIMVIGIVNLVKILDKFIGEYYKKLRKGGTIIKSCVYGKLHY